MNLKNVFWSNFGVFLVFDFLTIRVASAVIYQSQTVDQSKPNRLLSPACKTHPLVGHCNLLCSDKFQKLKV